MKILFSPSEGKKEGGDNLPISNESFIFPDLYEKREDVLKRYSNYLTTASDEQLSRLFGIKDISKAQTLKHDIFTQPTLKAVKRYNGVAYDYLEYDSLDQSAKDYIDTNTIIFSNLFGPVLASNHLPYYKLKQGEKIDDFALELFYKQYFSKALDKFLQDEQLLDLRAGFYTKFYKPVIPYVTLKFLKNGKSVSHWAKAYRGIILNLMAQNNTQNIAELMDMKIHNLIIKEVKTQKLKTEIIYDIVS